jgi:hypothetical protein
MIKVGNDHFEATHLEPKVDVCDKHYVFDAMPNSSKALAFTPSGRCPPYVVNPEIAGPAIEKEHEDEQEFVKLAKFTPTAPIHSGLDGGMNRVFLAQVGGNIPPARVPPPSALPQQPPPVGATADNGEPSLAGKLFGGLFASAPAAPTQVAATESAVQERGSAPAKPKPAHHETETAAAKPKPSEPHDTNKNEAPKSEPQQAAAPKAKPATQEANAAAQPAGNGGVMNGAQPAVPAGSFDSRWGGLQ